MFDHYKTTVADLYCKFYNLTSKLMIRSTISQIFISKMTSVSQTKSQITLIETYGIRDL